MANYYCEFCGTKAATISSLVGNGCPNHPDGPSKGKHSLYEGGEKSEYFCKLCGYKATTLFTLTNNWCPRHPKGPSKGKHLPAR